MSNKGRKREESDKGNNEQKQRSPFLHMTMTEYELTTLKMVLRGYLGFLSNNFKDPQAVATQGLLQGVYDRLPEHPEAGDVTHLSYEERMAILETVIGFKMLLITAFPHTSNRDVAFAEVERLYQCLIHAWSLPLN